ncbi:transglutaminase TgpA family protein [Pirellulaceae bacterium SH501]
MHRSIELSLRQCSFYFGILAVIIAGLVGLGNESWNLPIIVALAVITGHIYTDRLGWFSLHRYLVYLLMISGAVVAVGQFLNNSVSNQLIAVGNLLVYVQLPLIYQKKSKRVFEQWGVFLLLELVVAALVNDNVLYGVLMIPVLGVGCAGMMTLAYYNSQMKHSESMSESIGFWSRLMHWMGRESSSSKHRSGVVLQASEPIDRVIAKSRRAWGGGRTSLIPLTIAVLIFTVGYFYTLPRLQVGAYEAESWVSASVGFSEQVSLRYYGDIRQNESQMFRLQMFNEKTGNEYLPNEPPYIRLTVLHKYYDGPTRGIWQKGDSAVIVDQRYFRRVPKQPEMNEALVAGSDSVIVSVTEKASVGEPVAVIPPFSHAPQPNSFYATRKDWRLIDSSDDSRTKAIKRRYAFQTYGFYGGVERALLPELVDCLDADEDDELADRPLRLYRREELTEFPASLSSILAVRDEILKGCDAEPTNKLARAQFLEQYLASGREFKYSLRLSPPTNSRIDPIADFLINKRKGHCEYFASSLAMLLRSMNIPTRIVSGFRPGEYNDLGGYFSVQQKHAHVWVEAYFSIDELRKGRLRETIPAWAGKGMWLRMDPTPAGEGSNAGGAVTASSGQTLGVMQDFWSEMILNMDKSRQGNMFSIFAETSEGSYDAIWSQFQQFLSKLQSSRLIGGLASPDRWFSWRAAVVISLVGAVSVLAYRLALWLFPQWTPKLSVSRKKRAARTSIAFFNRLTKVLKRLGFERASWQTPQEFLAAVRMQLEKRSIAIDDRLLADSFYRLRYGGESVLDAQTLSRLDQEVRNLEAIKKPRFG